MGIKKTLSLVLLMCILLASCGNTAENGVVTTEPNTETTTETITDIVTEPITEEITVSEFKKIEPADGKTVKIACVGDSITYGYGADNPSAQSYPAQLQKMLGDGYKVGNFGKSSAYALDADNKYNVKDASLSYRNTSEYKMSLRYKADVVILMLGSNDVRGMTCDEARAELVAAIKGFAEEYAALPTVKAVYIAGCKFSPNVPNGQIAELAKRAADELGFPYIDVYGQTYDYMNVHLHYVKDHAHPTAEGYKQIAKVIYSAFMGEKAEVDTMPVSETGVVFVKGNGKTNGDGKTPKTAIDSIAKAVGLLRESGGTIVICGPYTTGYTVHLPDNKKTITVTSVYDGVDYRDTADAKLVFSNSFYLNGDYVFDDIELSNSSEWNILVCNYNDVLLGDDVKCTLTGSKATHMLLLAGANGGMSSYPESYFTFNGECNITVNSGSWLYIKCGNRRGGDDYPIAGIAEGAKLTVTVNGGVYTNTGGSNLTSVTGMNSTLGECNLIINGGEFRGPVYAVGRIGDNTTGEKAVMSGTVNLEINGGIFKGRIYATQDNSVEVTGNINVICAAEYESKLQGNFTNKTIK